MNPVLSVCVTKYTEINNIFKFKRYDYNTFYDVVHSTKKKS